MAEGVDACLEKRIDSLTALLDSASVLLRGGASSCFGHMRARVRGRESDVLLGRAAAESNGIAIIDWRTAPLAEAFFAAEEGEEIELEIAGRTVAVTVLEKELLGFQAGRLCDVWIGERHLILGPDRRIVSSPDRLGCPLAPREPAARARARSPIDVPLDAAQRRAVDLPAGTPLLVLGEAGCGKTTVALHRLARLSRASGPGFKAAVVVPVEGLRRLIESLLAQMGVAGVEVWLYDRWAAREARRTFRDLPARESQDASAACIRLKRHPALRAELEALSALPPAQPEEDDRAPRSRARATRYDLQHLFGDRARMRRVLQASQGALPDAALGDVAEHTRVQFSERSEDVYAHVFDAERLRALDCRPLDEGTPDADVQTVDVEDYAVLFELERLRAGRAGVRPAPVSRYDCLVIDEAQELAPLELALLGRALAPGGSLVVAGDSGQQTDPTSCFFGWDATLAELGQPRYQRVVLETSYRCPQPVTAFARAVLGLGGERAAPVFPALSRTHLASECHVVFWLAEALRALHQSDPGATVAVILRTAEAARRFASALERGFPVRLGLDGAFDFGPGVTVTCVDEVKGLEFDHVIIPDASEGVFPDTPQSRRALYVAATRACHQLVLASARDWAPSVCQALDGGARPAGGSRSGPRPEAGNGRGEGP